MEFSIVIIALLVVTLWFIFKGGEDLDENDVPTDPVTPLITIEELGTMTKTQLLEFAGANGIDVRSSWSKVRIKVAIIEQLGL